MNNNNIIGIVGGIGPQAGVDLLEKIIDQTIAQTDQEHLPVALLSYPEKISPRTAFLDGIIKTNPGFEIAKVILKLEKLGAGVIGIACNSAHSAEIYNVITEELKKVGSGIKLINIIEEVADFVKSNNPGIKNIGVLCTSGTCRAGIYQDILAKKGLKAILPDK